MTLLKHKCMHKTVCLTNAVNLSTTVFVEKSNVLFLAQIHFHVETPCIIKEISRTFNIVIRKLSVLKK